MAGVHSYGAVLAVRLCLGFVEAPFCTVPLLPQFRCLLIMMTVPGALLMLTSWYARDELPLRIAVLYAGNTLSNCFGGMIAAGVIGGMNGVGGLSSWRWLFVLEGSFTVAVAIGAFFVLPNYPKGKQIRPQIHW
jgi:sugar phosphate permease